MITAPEIVAKCLSVACPSCGAAVGEQCILADSGAVHFDRAVACYAPRQKKPVVPPPDSGTYLMGPRPITEDWRQMVMMGALLGMLLGVVIIGVVHLLR